MTRDIFGDNRILAAYDRMEKQIEDRIAQGLTTKAAVEETRKGLDMDFEEYIKFQELKSLAVAQGVLTAAEGQTIYSVLGEAGPEKFNSQPAYVKVVLTSMLAQLIELRLAKVV